MTGSIQRHLFRIDELLQGGKRHTASELARELGVSSRTVNRYTLRLKDDFGAPIEGDQGGYRYSKPFTLKPFQLSDKDLFALYAARSVLEQYKGSFLTEQIEERIAELVAGLVERDPRAEGLDLGDYLSFRISGTPVSELDSLMELLECALLRSRIDMEYRTPGSDEARRRRVDPYGLSNRDGVWYLVGFDHQREKVIPFNVSRIRRFRRTGRHFEREETFDLEGFFREAFGVMRGGDPERVRVRFSAAKAHFVREREFHPDQIVAEREDGGLDFEVTVDRPEEILHFVLGFGKDAEVLEPDWLRNRIQQEVTSMKGLYDSKPTHP